jgi:hypothetical protein
MDGSLSRRGESDTTKFAETPLCKTAPFSNRGGVTRPKQHTNEDDRMPKLQIDGTDVAEIDANLAENLRRMVSLHGVGRNRSPRPFNSLFPLNWVSRARKWRQSQSTSNFSRILDFYNTATAAGARLVRNCISAKGGVSISMLNSIKNCGSLWASQ